MSRTGPWAMTRVSREVLQESSRADDLMEAARQRAKAILKDALEEAKKQRNQMLQEEAARHAEISELADEELIGFINSSILEKSAEAFRTILLEAGRMRADFEALTPWVSDLVLQCLKRILGKTEADRIKIGLISQGLSELKNPTQLRLRLHPDDIADFHRLKTDHPQLLGAIGRIDPDATMTPGEITLVGDSGFLELGLDTQLKALAVQLDRALAVEGTT